MSWSITGDRPGTRFRISGSGVPSICGSGKHHIEAADDSIDPVSRKRLAACECSWSIWVPSEEPWRLDPNREGLLKRIKANPNGTHGSIHYFEQSPQLLGFTVVVPEIIFSRIQRLFELLLSSDSLEYSLAGDFPRFRAPHANTETPSLDEFMNGKPYFFKELNVAVFPKSEDT